MDPFAPAADHTGTTHTHTRRVSGTPHSQGTPTRGSWRAFGTVFTSAHRPAHTHSRVGRHTPTASLPGERHSPTNAQWTRLLHHRQKTWLANKKGPNAHPSPCIRNSSLRKDLLVPLCTALHQGNRRTPKHAVLHYAQVSGALTSTVFIDYSGETLCAV